MFTTLAATLSLASAPLLPAEPSPAVFALAIERNSLTAINYSDDPQWLVFESGSSTIMRAIAPHSSLAWQFPASCLSDVEVSLLRPQRAGWMQSERCSLTEHSELYFSADARAYRAQAGGLEALDCLHVPVIRPESRPNGGQPPHIGDKPLPPV